MTAIVGVAALDSVFGNHYIHLDAKSNVFWCALCSHVAFHDEVSDQPEAVLTQPPPPPQASPCVALLGSDPMEALRHIQSPSHLTRVELHLLHLQEFCPIELNGIAMLLDHHVIFPASFFGPGRLLYDDTLGMAIAPDITGAVKLFPNHRYTVAQMMIPDVHRVPDTVRCRRRNAYVYVQQRHREHCGVAPLLPDAELASTPMGPSHLLLYEAQHRSLHEGHYRSRRCIARGDRYRKLRAELTAQREKRRKRLRKARREERKKRREKEK